NLLSATCTRCHMEWLEDPNHKDTAESVDRRRKKKTDPPKKPVVRNDVYQPPTVTNRITPEYVRVCDWLRTTDEHGEEDVEVVYDIDMRVLPPTQVPDLTIDAAWAEFFRWYHKETARREKRYGRDWLRRRGMVSVGRVEDRGKVVTLYVPDGDVDEARMLYDIVDE